jgi:hypothetical protein
MKIGILEIDFSMLPMIVKLKGKDGKCELFSLKPAGRKFGIQLTKPDAIMQKLLDQH